jgi:hypothetical protein
MNDNKQRSEGAKRQKERGEATALLISQLMACRLRLGWEIDRRIQTHRIEFPGREDQIKMGLNKDRAGYSVITRPFNPTMRVRFRFSVEPLLLECKYSVFSNLDCDYALAVQEDGSIRLSDGASIEVLAERLLKPILFPHFA